MQAELADRLGLPTQSAVPMPTTIPHAGAYRLQAEQLPEKLAQSRDMIRLVDLIPRQSEHLQDQALAIIEADLMRAALTAAAAARRLLRDAGADGAGDRNGISVGVVGANGNIGSVVASEFAQASGPPRRRNGWPPAAGGAAGGLVGREGRGSDRLRPDEGKPLVGPGARVGHTVRGPGHQRIAARHGRLGRNGEDHAGGGNALAADDHGPVVHVHDASRAVDRSFSILRISSFP